MSDLSDDVVNLAPTRIDGRTEEGMADRIERSRSVIGAESRSRFKKEDARKEQDGKPGPEKVWPTKERWPIILGDIHGRPLSGCQDEGLLKKVAGDLRKV